MSLKGTLKKALSQEQFDQVIDALGDDFNFDLVPRTRLNKVIRQRNELQKLVDEEGQSSSDSADDSDLDDGSDDGDPTPQLQQPKKAPKGHKTIEQLEADHKREIEELKIQYAVAEKLRGAKAVDPDLIWNGGLLDKSKLKFDEAGKLTGFDDQLKGLQKDKAFLFSEVPSEDKNQGAGDGGVPAGTGRGGSADKPDISAIDSKLNNVFAQFGVTSQNNSEE